MTVNLQATGSEISQDVTTSGGLLRQASNFVAVLAKFGHKALANINSVLKSFQTARMMSTLSEMSDHQLEQIGISRSDIPEYAERLMN